MRKREKAFAREVRERRSDEPPAIPLELPLSIPAPEVAPKRRPDDTAGESEPRSKIIIIDLD
jgi:hypothetical protein